MSNPVKNPARFIGFRSGSGQIKAIRFRFRSEITFRSHINIYIRGIQRISSRTLGIVVALSIALTTTSMQNLNKSFSFRSHTLWNSLPFDLRNSMILSKFKIKLAGYFWNVILTCIQDTLSSRAALGLPCRPLGRVRRASKGILHTRY